MHDSLTAPGGGITLFNMMLGEVAPGGVGSGLYGMLMLAVVTVFLAGLMVGRTPEYLGKKIGQREIILVAFYVLATPVLVLVGGAIGLTASEGLAGLLNSRAARPLRGLVRRHLGVQQQRLGVRRDHLGHAVLEHPARAVHAPRPVPADGPRARPRRRGSPRSRKLPPSAGTLPTHRPLFVVLLSGVALVVVGLTYVPVLVLGPIVESLS